MFDWNLLFDSFERIIEEKRLENIQKYLYYKEDLLFYLQKILYLKSENNLDLNLFYSINFEGKDKINFLRKNLIQNFRIFFINFLIKKLIKILRID